MHPRVLDPTLEQKIEHWSQEETSMPNILALALLVGATWGSTAAAAGALSIPNLQAAGSGYEAIAAKMMTVVSTSADVHAKASTQSKIAAKLRKGAKVSVKEMTATGWAHVLVNGSDGYVDGKLLK
jgi:uncharacterized protein YgiM (DUF1202 family)